MHDERASGSAVHRALAAWFPARAGRVLLAVSGGADSLALLLGSAAVAPERIGVASLDHGLRPESADEVARVHALAGDRGLPFHTETLALRAGAGLEARAREARYAALERIADANGYAVVATGHTADDQAETLLMRLARGASLRGAAGIHADLYAGRLARPLLAVRRRDTEAVVRAAGLVPVQDPMNRDPALLRTRVRTGALPALVAAAGSGVVEALARFAADAAEDEAWLEARALEARDRLASPDGALDAVGVRSLAPPLRRRVLRGWLESHGVPVSSRVLRDATDALARGAHAQLPGRRTLRAESGWLRPVPASGLRASGALPSEVSPLVAGTAVDAGRFRVWLGEGPGIPVGDARGPLCVRSRRPGDRVRRPGGLSRRVQDVLVDARVPEEARAGWPLVVDAGGAVRWVVGVWPRPHAGPGPFLQAEPRPSVPESPRL